MAAYSGKPRFLAAIFCLVLLSLAGTGTPRGRFPVPAGGPISYGPPKAMPPAPPPLLPHLSPDIAFTPSFLSGKLEYVHSAAFAEAMLSVASGTSRYSPRVIPSSWPAIAREWRTHRSDCDCGRTIRALSGGAGSTVDPASRTAIGTLFPVREPARSGSDRVSALLFLSSLEYRSRQGDGRIPLVTPTRVRMGVGEILASVRNRQSEARVLEDRLYGIAARIVLAERLGATERVPRELALVRAEWRYARHAFADGTFDLEETEASIRRAEEAASRLLDRLHALSS